jgi:hypothetical protein
MVTVPFLGISEYDVCVSDVVPKDAPLECCNCSTPVKKSKLKKTAIPNIFRFFIYSTPNPSMKSLLIVTSFLPADMAIAGSSKTSKLLNPSLPVEHPQKFDALKKEGAAF